MTEAGDLPGEAQPIDFAKFYMGEMPKLVAFTMRLGADLSEANDIAQQAFVNAYPKWLEIAHPGA